MSGAYYNEFDKNAAAWLRELINTGEIAPGDVDERSITDVDATELAGYAQLHFFAGIGGWSRALRLAGIGDGVRIVTGSCPCQPFSSAGNGNGFDDPRHLWPHFYRLISTLRPARVVGEQVASPDALIWWDAVCADLEGAGYAGWAADLCSAGIGAAHIRQRLYWVADSIGAGLEGYRGSFRINDAAGREIKAGHDSTDCNADRLANANNRGKHSLLRAEPNRATENVRGGPPDELERHLAGGLQSELVGLAPSEGRPGPSHGIRRDADWLHCRDGKWRPVKPGLVPLVDGLPRGVVPSSRVGLAFDADKTAEARTMRLKGYGNAIDPELAAMFLRAVL